MNDSSAKEKLDEFVDHLTDNDVNRMVDEVHNTNLLDRLDSIDEEFDNLRCLNGLG